MKPSSRAMRSLVCCFVCLSTCAAVAQEERVRWNAPPGGVAVEHDRLFRSHQRLLPHLDHLEIDYDFEPLPGIGHNLGLIKEECGEKVVLTLAEQYAAAR